MIAQVTDGKLYNFVKALLEKELINKEIGLVQEELDLAKGRNTNMFSYKGQFSPDFISNLLKRYAHSNDHVFDPFVGSGTVLFEAARRGLACYGAEINPAAYEMANTSLFFKLNENERKSEIKKVTVFVESMDSFLKEKALYDFIEIKIKSCKNVFSLNILKNAYISLLSSKKSHTKDSFLSFVKKHGDKIIDLPQLQKESYVYLSDARAVPINSNTIDLIVTSPPYINVFNYHQHNRSFIDRIYGNALTVAKSEFGANRKHRQNRFFTVTQYILDMAQAFVEMKRILKTTGRLILIVGKSSKVRGVDFRNDHIITGVAAIIGYNLIAKQERKFLNQYGEYIFEEILHFVPFKDQVNQDFLIIAKEFAIDVLRNSRQVARKDVVEDIDQAIEKVFFINPSPILV